MLKLAWKVSFRTRLRICGVKYNGFTDETIPVVAQQLEGAEQAYMSYLGGAPEQWGDLVATYDPGSDNADESEVSNAFESVLEDVVQETVDVYMALPPPRPGLG